MILSVVSPGTAPWTYTSVRSVFSETERTEQTVASVASVRTHLPDAHVVVVECADVPALRAVADTYVVMEGGAKTTCLTSPIKGYGEVLQTLAGLRALPWAPRRLFKLSGRYQLTPAFDASLFSETSYTFSKRHAHGTASIPTVLYCVPCELMVDYIRVLHTCVGIYQQHAPGLEELLPQMCSPRSLVEPMGVQGRVGVDGTVYSA